MMIIYLIECLFDFILKKKGVFKRNLMNYALIIDLFLCWQSVIHLNQTRKKNFC